MTEVKIFATNAQQFYCFAVLGEMFDRLSTSVSIVGFAQAQLVEERQNSFIASLMFSRAGFVRFNNCVAISYTLIMDNVTEYNEFCAKEEAQGGGGEFRPWS